MDEQNQQVVLLQGGSSKKSPIKIVTIFVLVLVVIALGFYGFAWISSPKGKFMIAQASEKFKAVLEWYPTQLQRAQEVGNVWKTSKNDTAEKVGIIFNGLDVVGNRIIPAGSIAVLRYDLDVGVGVNKIPLDLECNVDTPSEVKLKDLVKKIQIIPPKPVVSTDDPSSYSDIHCRIDTKKIPRDLMMDVEGKISFPVEKQRSSIPVYFASKNELSGKDFFEKMGIPEKYPIRAKYNNEPVELGIGVSTENVQPVKVGDDIVSPSIGISLRNSWNGRVTEIREMNLFLPKGVKINKKYSPKDILCPFGDPIPTALGTRVKYSADPAELAKIPGFGKGVNWTKLNEEGIKMETLRTYHSFFCWLEVDENILQGSSYVLKDYMVDISYTYESDTKSETVMIKSFNLIDDSSGPSIETKTKTIYHKCVKSDGSSSCVPKCTSDCLAACEEITYESYDECQSELGTL